MGRTHAKKLEAREARLQSLPQSQRLVKSALIKKKEGRVLDAAEKHALKMTSEHGEVLRLWEKLRTVEDNTKEAEDVSTAAEKKSAYEHKYPVVEKLMHLIDPKFATFVKTPSGSRVIQSMIKYGSAAHVEKILKWVSKDFTTYATDAYAHFVIAALIRHAPHETYNKLLAALIPAAPQLITHKFGIEVMHAAYSSRWCSAVDRNLLLLAIFKDNVAVMKHWPGYPVLEDVIRASTTLKKRLLTRLFDLTDKLVSQKEAIGYPFVQRLVYTFIRNGTRDEVSELCDTMRSHLAAVAMTREGAALASLAFSLTEPKKRKEVLRSFTDNLGELSTNKYSAPVIARLFDLLYDAQLVKKYVANDMAAHIGQVINSPYGYLILMHLLTPRDERKKKFLMPNWMEHNLYSHENTSWNHHAWLTADYKPEVVEICSKPAAASHLAVLPMLVEAFLKYVQDEQNAKKMVRHHVALIAREILVVTEQEPAYKTALQLSTATRKVLESLAPADGKRSREADVAEATPAAKKPHTEKITKKKKKSAVEGEVTKKKVAKATSSKRKGKSQ